MRVPFPYNTLEYLSGFSHVGTAQHAARAPAGLIRRTISGTTLFDGLGPWPYAHIENPEELRAMAEAYRDLVTLTLITQPGCSAVAEGITRTPLKAHFIHDPTRPAPSLSRRGRHRLRLAERALEVTTVVAPDDRMELARCYGEVSTRRGFAGGFFDFPEAHFLTLAALDQAIFFRASTGGITVGMACGLRFCGDLHLLHIALTAEGLKRHAAYPLMHAIIDDCRARKVRLYMGGTPRVDGQGIERFKRRWTNSEELVFMFQIVNDRAAYAALCAGRADDGFFPAYRRPTEFR